MPRKLVLDTTNTYLFLETVNLDSIVLLQLRLETVRFTWPYGVYIHVWGLEIYRIAASTKASNPEKYECGLGTLLVAILHVITSNLAKSCLQSSSRWTVPKTTTVLINLLYCLGIHLLSIEYWMDDDQRMLTMWCMWSIPKSMTCMHVYGKLAVIKRPYFGLWC